MSVEQIAAEVNVSKVSIRRHLELLKRDGLVKFEIRRHVRGRPVHVYSLTDRSRQLFSTGSVDFAADLLKQISSIYGQIGVCRILGGQADEIIASLKPDLEGLSFESKVERLFDLINDRGFEITLFRLDDGSYLVRQGNCPLVSVATRYEQICQQEIRIYKELLETEVFRDCRIAEGASSCDYRILPPDNVKH
jgi:predicted ArsR family transcriptional regulator